MAEWIRKLKNRWGLKSAYQVIMVLVVFALTGTTVLLIKKPILSLFLSDGVQSWWHWVIYLILILPVYNLLLLMYGFLLGQFSFFWRYEKKVINRLVRKKPNLQTSDHPQEQ